MVVAPTLAPQSPRLSTLSAGLKNMNNLQVQSDVLLLADVIQQYRKECWDNFKLDPLHYMTLPGVTFDACLRYTGVKVELLKCPMMYQFCEQAIR